MPVNAGGAIQGDMLSGIEEESDVYEAFAPHVDIGSISLSTESSPGRIFDFLFAIVGHKFYWRTVYWPKKQEQQQKNFLMSFRRIIL